MWINDIKCKYMFMFPVKNLARKGLTCNEDGFNNQDHWLQTFGEINHGNRIIVLGTDKISFHSYEGFAFYVKRITISNYSTECNLQNCYVCHTLA